MGKERDESVRVVDKRHFDREGEPKGEALRPEGAEGSTSGDSPDARERRESPDGPGLSVFTEFILSLSTSCYVSLGVIPDPAAKKSEVDLVSAASIIDILDELRKKTRGNLTENEKDVLEKTLYGLKLKYLQTSEKKNP